MRIVFHRLARADIRDAKYWFRVRDRRSPEVFQSALDNALATLSQFPRAGAPYEGETRRLQLRVVPYSLIYHETASRILVVALQHDRQSAAAWLSRLN